MDVTIPFTMETQMHTAGPSRVSRFIARDVRRTARAIYVMVMREFCPVFCISVFIEKGIMQLTLTTFSSTLSC